MMFYYWNWKWPHVKLLESHSHNEKNNVRQWLSICTGGAMQASFHDGFQEEYDLIFIKTSLKKWSKSWWAWDKWKTEEWNEDHYLLALFVRAKVHLSFGHLLFYLHGTETSSLRTRRSSHEGDVMMQLAMPSHPLHYQTINTGHRFHSLRRLEGYSVSQ